MRIRRMLPPAAAPIPWSNICGAYGSCFSSSESPAAALAKEFISYFGSRYCFFLTSGKSALTFILEALHEIHPERDEVLIPAFTCFSVPAAIRKAGLKIRLCDLDIQTLDFDRRAFLKIAGSEKRSKKILCVVPTHFFGTPADVTFCRNTLPADVTIIEDAAQAMGNTDNGRKLATIGDAGFLSLGRGKALSAIEGGVILTNRHDIGKTLAKRCSFIPETTTAEKLSLATTAAVVTLLQNPMLFWLPKGLPFLHLGETIYDSGFEMRKLSPSHIELAGDWVTRLRAHKHCRKKNTEYFFSLVQKKFESRFFPWFNKNISFIRLPGLADSKISRNRIVQAASELGLGVMPSYPCPINEIEGLRHNFPGETYPAAKKLSEQLFTIPTHEYVRKKDYQKICGLLSAEI